MAAPGVPPPPYGSVDYQGGANTVPPAGTYYAPTPGQSAGYAAVPTGYSASQAYPPAGGVPVSGVYSYGQDNTTEAMPAQAEAVFNLHSFSDKAIRRAFIRKVYLILMAQLLVTTAVVALFVLHTPTREWVMSNDWFYGLSYAVFFVTYITLICCPGVRRQFPGNYICLIIFTLAFSYMTGAIASYHQAEAVLIAAAITAAVTLAISLFAMQTKIDFTMCSGLIFAASMVLLFAGFAFIIVASTIYDNQSFYYLQCTYGAIAALVLALFLVFDTQLIVGGQKRQIQLSPEEHIVGALQLYLDIVYIFLIILGFSKK